MDCQARHVPLRKSAKGRFASSSKPWISFFAFCATRVTRTINCKQLYLLFLKLAFHVVCLPVLAMVIVVGNFLEILLSHYRHWPMDRPQVIGDACDCSSSQKGNNVVSLVVSAVSRRQVHQLLHDTLGLQNKNALTTATSTTSSPQYSDKEPVMFEEMIAKFMSNFSAQQQTSDSTAANDVVHFEVVKIARNPADPLVTNVYLLAIRCADLDTLQQVTQALGPKLIVGQHGPTVMPEVEVLQKIIAHFPGLIDLLDASQAWLGMRQKSGEVMQTCMEKVTSAALSITEKTLRLALAVPTTLNVLISQVTRRMPCCNSNQFFLFRRSAQKDDISRGDSSVSLAYSECLPSELLKRIQETTDLSPDVVALSCISSALRAYAQEVTGSIPRDAYAMLQPGKRLNGLEGAQVLLPVEAAHDMRATVSRVQQRLSDSMQQLESCRRDKQLMYCTLPAFLSRYIQQLASSRQEIVITRCYLEGDEQPFLRQLNFWSAPATDTLLSLTVMHRKEGISIAIACRKHAIQSATLLAEFMTKSVTNLCIAFGIQWDRRSPPSTPDYRVAATSAQTL